MNRLCLVLSVFIFFGCAGKDEKPASLIDGISSHTNFDGVKNQLKLRPGDWLVLEDYSANSDRRPRYDILSISVKNYSHLGVDGELIMHFFNDRLSRTVFYPSDFKRYEDALEKNVLSKFGMALEVENGAVRRWKGKDFKNRNHVGWEHIGLAEEQHRWIMRHT